MNLQLVPDQQRQREGSCWADFGQDEMVHREGECRLYSWLHFLHQQLITSCYWQSVFALIHGTDPHQKEQIVQHLPTAVHHGSLTTSSSVTLQEKVTPSHLLCLQPTAWGQVSIQVRLRLPWGTFVLFGSNTLCLLSVSIASLTPTTHQVERT